MNSKAYTFAIALIILLICWGSKGHAQTLDPFKDYRYVGKVVRAADGTTARSTKTVNAFKMAWACPVTGKHTGACTGWAIDHIVPLDCGGVDAVWNMQWLPDSTKSAKGPFSKDHFERRVYGGHAISQGCP